jgi:hypothetical protein
MAAGDYRVKITQVTIQPGSSVTIEYRYGVEDKTGAVGEPRADTLPLSWPEFVAVTTSQERAELQSVVTKLLVEVKTRITKLGGSLDL